MRSSTCLSRPPAHELSQLEQLALRFAVAERRNDPGLLSCSEPLSMGACRSLLRSTRPAGGTSREFLAAAADVLGGGAHHDTVRDFLYEQITAPATRTGTHLQSLRVLVVGAGISGLAAAFHLQAAGAEVSICEAHSELGGTWARNTYPGCRVDVPTAAYQFSFHADLEHQTHAYSTRAEIADYLVRCAQETGLAELIRYNTRLRSASFDTSAMCWKVALESDGELIDDCFDVVVSAVGQLSKPMLPSIPGLEGYEGRSFHSSLWPADFMADGQRVAVVGTGASATQIIAAIGSRAAALHVFQRSPNWVVPVPNYRSPTTEVQRDIAQLPDYARWLRVLQLWHGFWSQLPAAQRDHRTGDVGEANDHLRNHLSAALRDMFAHEPDLCDALTPSYPPLAKRPVLDDGSWAATMAAPSTSLHRDGIKEVSARHVLTGDGQLIELDAIVFATGFEATSFGGPLTIRGRDGRSLSDIWQGTPQAFLGVMVPNLPNFFMMYGPNTNVVVDGNITWMAETAARYVVRCLRHMTDRGATSVECRVQPYDAFAQQMSNANNALVWADPAVTNWYQSAGGTVTQNWPHSPFDYWLSCRSHDVSTHQYC